MEKLKFRTAFDNVPIKPSPTGKEIYEWEYLDEKGEIKKDKMNVYEKIQSYVRQVDYKSKIERGEEFDGNALYLDISKLGNDPSSISEYLASIVSDLREVIQKENAERETTKTDEQSKETSAESSKTEEAGGGK